MVIDTLNNPIVGGSSEAMDPDLKGFDHKQIAEIGAAFNDILAEFEIGSVTPDAEDTFAPQATVGTELGDSKWCDSTYRTCE